MQNEFNSLRPLESRPYRVKKAAIRFFCPLCRTERSLSVKPRLSAKNYVQIFCAFIFSALVLFPLMKWNSLYLLFVIWLAVEAGVRLRFKNEIPCPHCGFDATWYKRDVNVARKKVAQFWEAQGEKVEESNADSTTATEAAGPESLRRGSLSQNDQANP